jgi:hypothetical protein
LPPSCFLSGGGFFFGLGVVSMRRATSRARRSASSFDKPSGMSDLTKMFSLIASAWSGDTEAQGQIESLPVWLSGPAEVDRLTGDCKAKWQALSAEIGYICSEWATIENGMEILFACVLRIEVAAARGCSRH